MGETYGFDEFLKGLDRMEAEFVNKAVDLLSDTGKHAVSEIKPRTPVDTGLLQSSMRSDAVDVSNLSVFVGTSVYYAVYVEYGHRVGHTGYVPGVFMIKDGATVAGRRFVSEANRMMTELTKEFAL